MRQDLAQSLPQEAAGILKAHLTRGQVRRAECCVQGARAVPVRAQLQAGPAEERRDVGGDCVPVAGGQKESRRFHHHCSSACLPSW